MDRHAFLAAQSWLGAAEAPAPPPASAPPQRWTCFVGAASLHISLSEQYGSPPQFRGALAPDALHLSFAVADAGADQQQLQPPPQQQPLQPPLQQDPMQLRLAVEASLLPAPAPGAAPAPARQQRMVLALALDGRRYRLDLSQAVRLVLPQQLAVALPAGAGADPDGTFLQAAPPSALPYLALVFPHACLNMFPLGWKRTAAHLSQARVVGARRQAHDAAEVTRLAQLLLDCRQQEALVGGGAAAPLAGGLPHASLPPAAGAHAEAGLSAPQSRRQEPDWVQRHAEFVESVRSVLACAEQIRVGGDSTANAAACAQLAAAAQTAAECCWSGRGDEPGAEAERAQRALAAALEAQHTAAGGTAQQADPGVAAALECLVAAQRQAAAHAVLAR